MCMRSAWTGAAGGDAVNMYIAGAFHVLGKVLFFRLGYVWTGGA